jgi:hypothetical protein
LYPFFPWGAHHRHVFDCSLLSILTTSITTQSRSAVESAPGRILRLVIKRVRPVIRDAVAGPDFHVIAPDITPMTISQ